MHHHRPPPILHKQQHSEKNEPKKYNGETDKSIWEKARTDPVAFFTLWLVIFTAVLSGVSVIQLKLLVRGETVAEKSANAANKSAEIAERALIAGQRAFVSVSFEPSGNQDLETGKITFWNFTPIWYNAGDTPTRNMQNHISSKTFDGPLSSEWDFPDLLAATAPPEDRLPTPIGAAPKGAVRGQTVGGISIDHMREIIAETKQLYMWGWASYNDVFPRTPMHVTRFAVQILVGGDPTDNKKISFVFKFIRRYNCSDEECEHQGYPASWVPRGMSSE
jgi:hypothetical protein